MKRATLRDVGELLDKAMMLEKAMDDTPIDITNREQPKYSSQKLTSRDLRWTDQVLSDAEVIEPSHYESSEKFLKQEAGIVEDYEEAV